MGIAAVSLSQPSRDKGSELEQRRDVIKPAVHQKDVLSIALAQAE